VAELAKKRAKERHGPHFTLGHEMKFRAERSRQHQHIRVTGVIGNEHSRSAIAYILLALDAHAPSA